MGGGVCVNRPYSRVSTTHSHITDCKLDSVVFAGVCGNMYAVFLTFGLEMSFENSELLEPAATCQSHTWRENNGIFQRGKIKVTFFLWRCMVFALSSMVNDASFCEPSYVVYSCNFSKNCSNPGFRTSPIGLYHVVYRIESRIGLDHLNVSQFKLVLLVSPNWLSTLYYRNRLYSGTLLEASV